MQPVQPDPPPKNVLLDVLKSGQSYRNVGYLLTTFPVGLMYFILMAVGISLGSGLAVIGVGIFILWGLFGLGTVIANFERWTSNQLLKTNLPRREGDVFDLRNGDNWRSVGYLALKFPLGLITFIITVTIISFNLGLILMPLNYQAMEIPFVFAREIDTLWEALVSSVFGIVLLPFALILLGKIALLWRNMNHYFLKPRRQYEGKKKNLDDDVYRQEIEQSVINRLIDQGLINEDSLVEEKHKNMLSN